MIEINQYRSSIGIFAVQPYSRIRMYDQPRKLGKIKLKVLIMMTLMVVMVCINQHDGINQHKTKGSKQRGQYQDINQFKTMGSRQRGQYQDRGKI